MSRVPIVSHTAHFRYIMNGVEREGTFRFWTRASAKRPDTLLFLGVGQIGKIPQWIAQFGSEHIIAVEGLPYWLAGASKRELSQFSEHYAEAVLKAVQQTFSIERLHIIGSSQATYAAVRLCLLHPAAIKNVALMYPLGFNAMALGKTSEARLKTFKKRIVQTMLQSENSVLRDSRNMYGAYRLLHAALADKKHATRQKFGVALSYDLLPDLRKLLQNQKQHGGRVVIALAGKDKIFRSQEIKATLASDSVTFMEFPEAAHTSIGLRINKARLLAVVAVLHDDHP